MTNFATLQLKNDAGTEVDFLVGNINYTNGVATWNATAASYDARRLATFSLALPTARSTRARVKAKVSIPIMDVVNPLLKVDEILCNIEFVIPKQASLADRKDIRAFTEDFISDEVIKNAIEKLESVY